MITETTTAPEPGTPDAKGTAYDPARHIGRQNPRTGRWMPRSTGRKPRAVSSNVETGAGGPAAPATPAANAETDAAGSAQTPPPAAAAPSFADIEAAAGPETPPTDETGAQAAGKVAETSPEADAQAVIAVEALETVTGFFTGVPEDARMTPAERAGMARVLARWFHARGWVAVGGFMVGIMCASFLMKTAAKEKTRAKIKEMWANFRRKEKSVGADVTAAPSPAAPAESAAPAAPRAFFETGPLGQ